MLETIQDDLDKIALARHHEPFSVLGNQAMHGNTFTLFYSPDTCQLSVTKDNKPAVRYANTDFFICSEPAEKIGEHYLVNRTDNDNNVTSFHDPYSFKPQIDDFDLHLFSEGKHQHIYRILGAHPKTVDGIEGVLFATWAPNAGRVSVIGDFNGWDGRRHPMRSRGGSGVWELFIPELKNETLYKFEIRNRDSGAILSKTDPYAQQFELRPKTASVIRNEPVFNWQDDRWIKARETSDWLHEPLSIYECHLGSWQRGDMGEFLNYRELAHRLVDYLKDTGFTHIELLPITEHPLDASWGYQTTGYFAPTSRFGAADDFRYFVDYCHQHDIGVLLDWVPAHFPKDEHGLAGFDGSALYEHEDPRKGEHRDWGTLIYNYGRNEVKNFLLASAVFWIEECHIDGLRVDAVASMLYLDYSREDGDWVPNLHGGNENIEAIEFMRDLNTVTHANFPGTMIMAEESTAWPQVTRPCNIGGLGFSMKWNMGWMHDTLNYFANDPVYRHYHHDQLTFGLLYLFTENFILPFSHDEVVHGKNSMLYKMPGDEWQRFANLRLLYTYMFTYPGKKLLFMGCEFGQGNEWNHDEMLDWYVLQYPHHAGIKKLVADLNGLYTQQSALHKYDFDPIGFEWIDCHDTDQSVLSYLRKTENESIVVVLNFTPVIRDNYRIGVPVEGDYEIIFNSDSDFYAGSNAGSNAILHAEAIPWMNRGASLTLSLPPLAGLVLKLK
ncbi:MAG: 1,4-alpha-glucan branching protein GlgB [Gammaproteobacteria bacterium]|nr:1,4-alpha-glucan branching protein GlgB [Gammaproteobacteria bacterium]MCW9006268.1 1,4-alpha-glucan branching protein GlgB [Gammaproteobacteria bacterium]MCW9056497.1 1,4-alpha-glucan branching protein GlgB [Gammaproteobacteria bacterium]